MRALVDCPGRNRPWRLSTSTRTTALRVVGSEEYTSGWIDRIVAGVYTSYLSVALESKAVKSVLTWGLTDAHTWLAGFMRPHTTDDKQPPRPPQRPLPFDPDLKPAPAFFAMRDVFDKAPHR